jgi:uncharacterized membrane protein HdeD (DUF308 family)
MQSPEAPKLFDREVAMLFNGWYSPGKLVVLPGRLQLRAVRPFSPFTGFTSGRLIEHTDRVVIAVRPRIWLPQNAMAILLQSGNEIVAAAMPSILTRGLLLEALRQAGFQVRFRRTWFSLGGTRVAIPEHSDMSVNFVTSIAMPRRSRRGLWFTAFGGIVSALLVVAATFYIVDRDPGFPMSALWIGTAFGLFLGCLLGVSGREWVSASVRSRRRWIWGAWGVVVVVAGALVLTLPPPSTAAPVLFAFPLAAFGTFAATGIAASAFRELGVSRRADAP